MQKNKNTKDLKEKKYFMSLSRIQNPKLLDGIRKENIEQIDMVNVKEKDKTDFSDIIDTLTLTSAISTLSSLAGETLEFSTMKNKNLLKDYEKIRFKKFRS
jgi:hypothetical protein